MLSKRKLHPILLLIILGALTGTYVYMTGYVHGKGKRRDERTEISEPLSAAEGQKAVALYSKTCAACHGHRLEGGVGPSLIDVRERYSIAKIEKIALRGKGKNKPVPMPAGLTTLEEARLLAHWLTAS